MNVDVGVSEWLLVYFNVPVAAGLLLETEDQNNAEDKPELLMSLTIGSKPIDGTNELMYPWQ